MATSDNHGFHVVQFLKFCLVGVVNTLVTLSVIFSLKYFFSIPDAPANFMGYVVGLSTSYVGNGLFTFKSNAFNPRGFVAFLAVFALAYGVNLMITLAAIESRLLNSYQAHLVGMVPYTIISFLGGKFFVYQKPSSA